MRKPIQPLNDTQTAHWTENTSLELEPIQYWHSLLDFTCHCMIIQGMIDRLSVDFQFNEKLSHKQLISHYHASRSLYIPYNSRGYRIRQNLRGGNFCGCAQNTYSLAIMYCTQQVIQGENLRGQLKNRKSFPHRKFCRI